MRVRVENHPLLEPAGFVTHFPAALSELPTPPEVLEWFARESAEHLSDGTPTEAAPVRRTEELRGDVRKLLRHGGYRPTGRGKPASEYLVRAAGEGRLGTINLAVDACNATSLHSGLPISVVDLERCREPLEIRVAGPGASYVFNAGGQEIGLEGLLCLCDADGPAANAVKDSQRTKTGPETRTTLVVVWGTSAHPGLAARVAEWQRELLESAGARCADVEFPSEPAN